MHRFNYKVRCLNCGSAHTASQNACPNCGCPTYLEFSCSCGHSFADTDTCPGCDASATPIQCANCGVFYPLLTLKCPDCQTFNSEWIVSCQVCGLYFAKTLPRCPECKTVRADGKRRAEIKRKPTQMLTCRRCGNTFTAEEDRCSKCGLFVRPDSGDGFVYVLINPHMEGLVKIGKTTRDPMSRAAELSQHTGLPADFILVFQQEVTNCDVVEQLVHEKLKKHRLPNKEFFSVPVDKAIHAVIEESEGYRPAIVASGK